MSRIALIAAVARNGVIGRDGGLPWQIPADLRWFKARTLGKAVVMGRRTWESLPRRPLPGRPNIVVSRQTALHADGAAVVHSLEAASDLSRVLAPEADEIMVIGGAELYAAALPHAARLYLTEVDLEPDGDTFMPPLDRGAWREVSREHHGPDGTVPGHDFVVLERL